MATLIPGEASETDDDIDYNESTARSEQINNTDQNIGKIRNHNDLNGRERRERGAQQRSYGSHVDEKLEERWQTLGYNTVKLAERQAFAQRKQIENLKKNLSNTQHAIQAVSSTFRQVSKNLEHVERNLSLLQDGAKLIPDLSTFSTSKE